MSLGPISFCPYNVLSNVRTNNLALVYHPDLKSKGSLEYWKGSKLKKNPKYWF